ncbi:hypothetical protein H3Z83_02565 [Tenacibaculum sp. S7007]|uniref:DUF4890 domain-containing protein n=1 Tax=Tenacibaculum pelagium TaxID=2759527 RepID=A0A839AJX9_9FLAO|nr:hypothetical protein [Tenacibaculum pelagium]MBA6155413.1 hypothetical protein [Tenacibaculum pelagium]
MKKIILTNLILLLFIGTLTAQRLKNPEKIINKQLEKVQEKLKLDNIQLLMIKEVVVKYQKEKIVLRNQEIPDEEKELSQFLNEEQLIEFKKIIKEQKKEVRKDRSRKKGSGNRRGRRNSF